MAEYLANITQTREASFTFTDDDLNGESPEEYAQWIADNQEHDWVAYVSDVEIDWGISG